MESMHEPVAVLGIGAMGHGMATSALRAGIRTIVWNRNAAATRDLAALGAEVAETAADAARQAAIIVTMVTDIDAVISIARDQGMLAALAPGVRSGSRQAPSAWQESSALPSWWMSSVLT